MKTKKLRDDDSRPVNRILVAVSFIIFGALGLIFLTQMEMQPGWAWEDLRDIYPMDMKTMVAEDLNGDGIGEVIAYADIHGTDQPERYSGIQYGGIFCLDGKTGALLWAKEYNGPVERVFPVMDVNGDNVNDYFVGKGSIGPEWLVFNSHYEPERFPNLNTNQLISGINGSDISILTGDGINFTNFHVFDLISLNDGFDAFDDQEDLIIFEGKQYEYYDPRGNYTSIHYACNISSYFINGTKTHSFPIFNASIHFESKMPALESFRFNDESHILYIDDISLILLNTSTSNFLDDIYNETTLNRREDYTFIEDLNGDYILEILFVYSDGNITLIDGSNGGQIRYFPFTTEFGYEDFRVMDFEQIGSGEDGTAFFLLDIEYWHGEDQPKERLWQIYSIDFTSEQLIWEKFEYGMDIEDDLFVFNEDMDGDLIDEIILFERHTPLVGFSDVRRYIVYNFIQYDELAILNTEYHAGTIRTIDDFDGDGKKDFVISGDDRVIALSSKKEAALWLSPDFPLGLPLFITLVVLLAIGMVIAVIWGKRLSYQRKNIKQHKLTVAVNVLAIFLMSITFVLFLILMNIFNNTLITGSNNAIIVITFLIVIITWYGTLPLTAAVYNRFAPQFAFIFIKLRDLFFKVSRSYHSEIIILDMEDRQDIGLTIQVKRLVLPLLLSIAVGFYAYNALTPILGLPQTFEVFGSTEFFDFMRGYMLCCVLPMILSFLFFAFLISGNFLLDDAGVVYFRQNKKYRQPGDIEPISIWAQSIIKGIAGLSALITFTSFLTTVDFSGFFGEGDTFMIIFGVLIVIVMFGGIPFLTGFSYILLAGEIMEITREKNVSKLYKIMEKDGYDIKPRTIYNIYPDGYIPSKKEKVNDSE